MARETKVSRRLPVVLSAYHSFCLNIFFKSDFVQDLVNGLDEQPGNVRDKFIKGPAIFSLSG